jgi:hypothetical protein
MRLSVGEMYVGLLEMSNRCSPSPEREWETKKHTDSLPSFWPVVLLHPSLELGLQHSLVGLAVRQREQLAKGYGGAAWGRWESH